MTALPRPRILLSVIAAVILLGGVGGFVATIWSDRDATLADWTLDLRQTSHLMETRVRALHANAHANLLRIEDRLADRSPAAIRDSEAERKWLERILAELPAGLAIHIHDHRGELLLSTNRAESHSRHLSGPDLIAPAMSRPGQTIITAEIAEDRDRRHVIVLSRALVDSSGIVRGVARLRVGGEYFTDFFHGLQHADRGTIFLVVRQDGAMIARDPLPEGGQLLRFDVTRHPFTEFARGNEGVYRAQSVVDGAERLVSYRHLPDLGLVVTSGMTMDMVFRDWTIRTQRNAALHAAGILLLLALATMTGESLRHETRLLRSVEGKADELAAALDEKDVLFQEVHHRVKNNLQVISSLLTMQSLHADSDAARDTLRDALDRIHSMGLVHQTLYERNMAANVDLGVYFGRLAEALVGGHGPSGGGVTVSVDVTGTLELDRAVPLGMLANEALSNALKHAFPAGRGGAISISLTGDETSWHFAVRDDGIGMPAQPGKGIGLSLIRALTRQLGGRFAISRNGGTAIVVTFPK
ncbi:sensor histidine kinase [Magnetospirillum sp. SS-4]|uniref:sensor histidine kinase n=1 Tax=Magnetospirillum sp. SS-4 TaxID=2681465 RepID=UPI00137D7067|nr:histidine kinase dimerization/phosphoacceptor domain -containing protein [Magnetospirillum sp. SS-4]CAA7612929.1 Signal transduction histidine kinase [Magnetospirillum sp. SS-4]